MKESIKDLLEKKHKIKKNPKPKNKKKNTLTDSVSTKNTINEKNTRRWSKKEIRILYKGLIMFGTDFSSISALLENKNRNQIIKKFHREEKKNCEKVENCLEKHLDCVDKLIFNFSGIIPEDTEFKKKRLNRIMSTDSVDPLIRANLRKNLNLKFI